MSIDVGYFVPIVFWLWVALICGLFIGVTVWVVYVAVRMWRER